MQQRSFRTPQRRRAQSVSTCGCQHPTLLSSPPIAVAIVTDYCRIVSSRTLSYPVLSYRGAKGVVSRNRATHPILSFFPPSVVIFPAERAERSQQPPRLFAVGPCSRLVGIRRSAASRPRWARAAAYFHISSDIASTAAASAAAAADAADIPRCARVRMRYSSHDPTLSTAPVLPYRESRPIRWLVMPPSWYHAP